MGGGGGGWIPSGKMGDEKEEKGEEHLPRSMYCTVYYCITARAAFLRKVYRFALNACVTLERIP